MATDSRYQAGLEIIAAQYDLEVDDVEVFMADKFGEAYARESIHSAGGVWGDGGLGKKESSFVVLGALIAQGGVGERIPGHVRAAVSNGATRQELEGLVTLLRLYAGTPKASIAMELVRAELNRLGL